MTGLLLAIQSVCMLLGIWAIVRGCLPDCRHSEAAMRLQTSVWLPIIIVTPFMFFVHETGYTIKNQDWFVFGAPVIIAGVGIAIALVERSAGPGKHAMIATEQSDELLWFVIAMIVALLGAADAVTMFSGLCALAAATTIMMVNSSQADDQGRNVRVSPWTSVAFLTAVGQGFIILRLEGDAALLGGAVTTLGGFVTVVIASVMLGKLNGLTLSGWTAGYACLISLGMLALTRFQPLLAGGQRNNHPFNDAIATGSGMYVFEVVLFAGIVLYLLLRKRGIETDRVAGTVLLAASIVVILVRIGELRALI